MEILPHRIESADFDAITSVKDVLFYILYVINLPKSLFKYRHRGYRLGLMEAGSMYQLAAMEFNKINLSNRVLAGFSEYDITCRCGLDPRTFLPLVIQAFGYEQED